ncbi:LytR/AlgR family response regulator transcription factor [Desulforudis sp. 1088]|uniref:LytR/AlgR family response regulator transcription factor n=1 Tax=unclassified Candidatus Desulforudis TaxID=2635950 RepID=UPI003CE459B8
MRIRALIVDDEYPARMELRYLLSKYESIEVIGEATNSIDAWQLISAVEYDVVFLDIELPGISGMELAARLKQLPNAPRVVFVTAFQEHACEAFGLRAIDYLLKPISEGRLRDTIARIQDVLENESCALKWLTGERNGVAVPVAVEDIIYAYAANNRTFLRTRTDRVRVRYTLEQLEQRLPSDLFFRSHRAYLINIDQIKEIRPDVNGAYSLVMNDVINSVVSVSRGRVQSLKKRLGLRGRLRTKGSAYSRKKQVKV